MAEQITWAGRTLSGTDRFGKWVTTGLDGWWDSPDPKGETIDRANADGEYDLPIYNEARLVTAAGHFHATSHEQMHEAMNYFTGPMAGRFQVSGHGSVQWADAKRNSGVKFTPVTDVFAQWQVRVKAPNPRKYGETRTFSTSTNQWVDIFHRGNYPAYPRFTVTGSIIGGYVLVVGGSTYHVAWGLEPGKPHTVDFADGRLRVNGVVVHGGVGITQTPGVLPGTVAPTTLTPVISGTANATVSLTDTYI